MNAAAILVTLCLAVPYLARAASQQDRSVESIVSYLVENHDSQRRPDEKEGATNVKININIEEAFWHDQDLTVILVMSETWRDSRLAYDNTAFKVPDVLKLKIQDVDDDIWSPDTFFVKAHTKDLINDGVIKIYANGTVRRTREYRLGMHYKMPAEQDEKITVGLKMADFRYNINEVKLDWTSPSAVKINEDADAIISDIKMSKEQYGSGTGAYDQLIATFTLESTKRRQNNDRKGRQSR